MELRLESRPVGDVLIVQSQGRIMVGKEVNTLHYYVQDSFTKYVDIVLQLDQVEFIDSSGLGALVRLMQAARAKGGDVKLSGVPPNIRRTLEVTNLLQQFETYDSVEEAVTAAYLGSRYSRGKIGDARPPVLCVYDSKDVCAFLREVLVAAGYNALTALTMSDALILLKATKAKRVVISAQLQTYHGRPAQQVVSEIDPGVSLIVLDENFANQDPGEAAEKLLSSIKSQ
ncbi:MAG: anti-sigma factor antagonist [Candidatus Korobacteraceae bacterium]